MTRVVVGVTQVVVAKNTSRHRPAVDVSPTIRSFLTTTSSVEAVENEADIIEEAEAEAEGEFVVQNSGVAIVEEEEPPQPLIAQEVEISGRVGEVI